MIEPLSFIIGAFIGMIIGVTAMALLQVGSSYDDLYYRECDPYDDDSETI